jgi:fucose 4-O-acetylase-like acetyltransferase
MPQTSVPPAQRRPSPRVEWVDTAKGIGIFLVVLGHDLGGLINSGVLPPHGAADFAVRWMYYFHMPLFFLLAGLFIRGSSKKTFAPFLSGKAAVILYPYVIWSLVSGVLQHYLSGTVNNPVPWQRLPLIIYDPIDQYWFLYVIFVMYLAYWLASRAGLTARGFAVMAALLYLGNAALPGLAGAGVVSAIAAFLIYFAAGALLADARPLRQAVAWPGMVLLATAAAGYAIVAVRTLFGDAWDSFLHPPVAAIGIGATIALAMALSRWRAARPLRLCGIYSLEIYVAHTLFSSGLRILLQGRLAITSPAVHIVAGTLIGLVAPLLLARACARLRFPYVFTLGRANA